MQGLGRVGARAFPTAQPGDVIHRDPPHRSGIGTWLSPLMAGKAGCRGVTGPVPQPLWMIPPWWTMQAPAVNERPPEPWSPGPDGRGTIGR